MVRSEMRGYINFIGNKKSLKKLWAALKNLNKSKQQNTEVQSILKISQHLA